MELDISKYRINKHSQCGEDGVIEKLMELAKIESGHLVEFGAWDGVYLSNTYYHYQRNENFKIVLIEPEKERYDEMTKNIRWDRGVMLNSFVETEGENSLNEIFKKYEISDIALLSIDVDGKDLEIWNSLDKNKYRPKIVVIEEGGWQDADRLNYLCRCFSGNGYNLVCVTGNFIFVDERLGIKSNNSVHELVMSSGHEEYSLYHNKIDRNEYDSRVIESREIEDAYIKYAEPQIIQYEEI